MPDAIDNIVVSHWPVINVKNLWTKCLLFQSSGFYKYGKLTLVTGSIARSAKLPVFSLLRGRFWGFSPRRGDSLHRWGWNLARRRGPKVPSSVQGTKGPLLRAKCHNHPCNDKGVGPQNWNFYPDFDRNVEYKRPAGAYPLRDFQKNPEFVSHFRMRWVLKLWLDLLKGLWSYGGFKLRVSGFPQIFSAP